MISEIGVLGPVRLDPAAGSGLGGHRQRRLLAALVVNTGNVVSTDRLVDIVFEGNPTDAASTTLRSYVARLRRALEGSGATVATRSPGYVLEPGAATVDAERFERALTDATAHRLEGRVTEALDRVNDGLSLWRGPAYAEFADEEWAHAEALRLDELRVQAEEVRIGCLVDLGRHDEALPDVAAFVERHPLREQARLLLLIALYRSGRHADAVRAADSYRRNLADIGLEPSKEFDRLENRVIVQDPDLRRPPRAGRALRGYRLGERLGQGEGSVVHRALQPGVERTVAITSYGPAVADHPQFIRDFEARVQEVAKIEHPGLLEIVDVWREPGSAHLVTRLMRGGDLRDRFEKGPLPAETVARMVSQIGAGLTAVHARGLWHGVLRPSDVLFDVDGSARLAGVGTVHIVDSIRRGTVEGAVDVPGPARDQLRLAALAHQALTGVVPPAEFDELHRLPRVSDLRPELLALDGVIARAGAANPEDRYPDVAAFVRSFSDALGAAPFLPGGDAWANPYKGLRAFAEVDTAEFFGREALTGQLVERLTEARLVVVVGASGSGKSSVVRAGVVPAVRSGAVPAIDLVATMVPGSEPAAQLTDALRRVVALDRAIGLDAVTNGVLPTLRTALAGESLLLIIDQFEELYTLVDDAGRRGDFIDGLMDAVDDDELDLRLLITLRADFFDRPLHHHRLGVAVSEAGVAVPAMSPSELEQAIVEPAAAAGVTVDPPVVAELVADVVDQPAGLPLLQFALTELFEGRRADRITMEDHQRLGGVAGAIAGRAERLYDDTPTGERDLVRLLFLRLVTVGEGVTDIRRRTNRSELLSASPDREAMAGAIDRFGAARLLTFDHNPTTREPTVEVAHEALLRQWPRLQHWIDDAGHDLLLRSHLTTAAAGWEVADRDNGELYRGARLAGMEEWVDRNDLSESERAFLRASLDERAAEAEAEAEHLAHEVRANVRLRRLITVLAVVLAVALVAGFTAIVQRNRARSETARAEQARGRGLAISAGEQLANDRSLALLLAVEAATLDDSDSSRRALLTALGGDDDPFTRTVIPTPADDYVAMALASDGVTAAAKRSDGSTDIIDLDSREVLVAGLPGPTAPVAGIDISSDGQIVVTSGRADDGVAAIVYQLDDGTEVTTIPARLGGGIHQAVFVPGTTEILIGDAEGVLERHDGRTGALLDTIDTETGAELTALTIVDRTAYVVDVPAIGPGEPSFLSAWDLDTGRLVAGPSRIDDEFVVAVEAGNGLVLASGEIVHAFEADSLAPLATFGEALGGSIFTDLAISPDGLVAAGTAIDLEVWFNVETGEPVNLEVTGQAPALSFSPDGSTLVTADPNGTLSTWRVGWIEDLGTPLEPEGPGLVTVSPGGDLVAVWARGRGVQLYEASTGSHVGELAGFDAEDSFLGLDFSPDGRSIVTLTCPFLQEDVCDAVLNLYDVKTGDRMAGPVDAGPVDFRVANGVEFTPDGTKVALATADSAVVIRDVPSFAPTTDPLDLADVSVAPGLRTMVVTSGERDGRELVAALGDFGPTVVWDTTDEPRPVGAIESPSNSIWFGPEGELFVGSVNGPVLIYDPLTLEVIGRPFPSDEPALRFSMSNTGVLAVSSGLGGTTLWDVETRQPISGDLPGFVSDVDPDGNVLYLGAIGFDEGGVRVAALPLDIDGLAADACHRAGRNLTADEWRRYMPEDTPYRPTCPEWPVP